MGLQSFAKENLKPVCSYINKHLCNERTQKDIEMYELMSENALQQLIAKKEQQLEAAEEAFENGYSQLQEEYEELEKEKDEKIRVVKNSGLSLMKAVADALDDDEDLMG